MATDTKAERNILSGKVHGEVVETLQERLVDLIDLALQCKQAHWNLVGPRFVSFHEQLDAIVATLRDASDEVAERIATFGVAADGRASTINDDSSLDALPAGRHRVEDMVAMVADRLHVATRGLRRSIDRVADLDPVSEDLLIGITAKLEKHLWMVHSQDV